ncbi:Zinc-binding oxidoreductase [Ceraceosorus bombacis]|uniref:Zinc-binding oxidoreductase n=1 Tax=Ceraceosorus bombacis TaxID=401625 RepID=A0A0P1BH94_9BASI|nr:Zinc-binding oxidoreductase [Ceraceosorus bombacis]
MRAIHIKGDKGPASALYIGEAPAPAFQKGQGAKEDEDKVIVRIKYAGINRMDTLQREGKYPIPPGASPILGVEFSGVVEDLVPSASSNDQTTSNGLKVGDEVFGLNTGGCYAELVKLPARMVLKKPKEISWEEAAAIPEVWLTAFQAQRWIANLQPGEDILIHAGASSVGLAAIQLAKSFGARHIYVTAGSQEKIDSCKGLGATEGINYKTSVWEEELKKLTSSRGVNVIMDFLGGPYFGPNIRSLALDGRLVLQGLMGGSPVCEVDLTQVLVKRLHIEGSTLRSRSLEYQSSLMQDLLKSGVLEKIVKGCNKPGKSASDEHHRIAIHKVFDWAQAKEAHEEMEANKNTGKILLKIT